MTTLRTGLLATAVAIFALPSVAMAEYLVPPGNSAVNQYTESVPTAGGHRDVEKPGGRKASPAKVLGAANARKLEEHGEQGRKAAEVAAATAPATATAPAEVEAETDREGETGGGGGTGKGPGSGGANGEPAAPAGEAGQPRNPAPAAPEASGSSGLGEVLAAATGSSSDGQLGLLLPLLLLGATAWGVAFLLRGRDRPTS